MEYYSTLNKKGILAHVDRAPWEHYAERNKPITKRQKLHDSTYTRFVKYSDLQKQ